MDPSEPESLIYSLGIFGSKDPQLGVFFWSLHPGTGGTQASPPNLGRGISSSRTRHFGVCGREDGKKIKFIFQVLPKLYLIEISVV